MTGETACDKLRFKKMTKKAHEPTRGSDRAAGFDLKRYLYGSGVHAPYFLNLLKRF